MNIFAWMRDTTLYLFDGALRLFAPTDDDYPKTRVQPFHGDPYNCPKK